MFDNSTLNNSIFLNGFSNSYTLKVLESPHLVDPLSPFPEDGSNLTIVVLSFNRVSCTNRLLDSIRRHIPGFKGEVLIMDNGSAPDQLELLEAKLAELKRLKTRLVKLDKNYGVAGARNKAMEYVHTDWFMSLDNDIYLVSNPLWSIKDCIEKLGVLFLNVPLLQVDGKTVDAFGGNLWTEPYEDTYFISGTSTFRQLPVKDIPKVDCFLSTFLFGGASVLQKKAFLENGGFEANMFIGFEDTEFSLRLVKKGIKIGNATSFSFIHAHEAPKNSADVDAEKARFSADRIRESGEYFRKKHGLAVWKPSVDSWIEDRFEELKIQDEQRAQKKAAQPPVMKVPVKKDTEASFLVKKEEAPVVNNHAPVIATFSSDMPWGKQSLERQVVELQDKLRHAEYVIRSMESSKFWQIRSFWFRQRKKLGLHDEGQPFSWKSLVARRPKQPKKELVAQVRPHHYEDLLKKVSPVKGESNVLVFIPFMVVGGAETAILQVLKGFRRNKVNTSLIVSSHPLSAAMGDTSEDFYKVCPDTYVLEDYNHLWGDPNNWEHWKGLTYALIRERKIHTILISNSSFAYGLLPDLKKDFPHLQVINPVYSVVGHMVDNIKYEPYIDLTVVENPLVEEYLLQECGRDRHRVVRVENGVDTEKYQPARKAAERRVNGITLPANKKIISFLGRLSEEKAPDIFLDIAHSLRSRKDVHFVLAGDGPMRQELIDKVVTLGLSDISVVGFADSVEVLQHTDIMLLPSRIDGRPNVVLESMAMSVPVIASHVGGLPWLVSESFENGFTCEAGNILDFRDAILELIDDAGKLAHFSRQARRFAEQHLDVKKMQAEYTQLCRVKEPAKLAARQA